MCLRERAALQLAGLLYSESARTHHSRHHQPVAPQDACSSQPALTGRHLVRVPVLPPLHAGPSTAAPHPGNPIFHILPHSSSVCAGAQGQGALPGSQRLHSRCDGGPGSSAQGRHPARGPAAAGQGHRQATCRGSPRRGAGGVHERWGRGEQHFGSRGVWLLDRYAWCNGSLLCTGNNM